MTANEVIRKLMIVTGTTFSELAEGSLQGSASGITQKVNYSEDMKVSTFVDLLETMGYRLSVRDDEDKEVMSL